jgi:hypothetical protein
MHPDLAHAPGGALSPEYASPSAAAFETMVKNPTSRLRPPCSRSAASPTRRRLRTS